MAKNNIRVLMAASAFAGALVLACNNVPQPKPGCTIGQGEFAAKYTPKAGETPTGACANVKGEIINLRDYTDQGTNYIAVRTTSFAPVAGRTDPNADDKPYAFGEFPKESNAESFCVVPHMDPARLRLDPAGASAAVDKTYEWTDVEILVTPRAAGTQLKASLKYTDAVSGCTANYDVVAMRPAIRCGTNGQPDNTKCATKADPANNVKLGCGTAGCLSPDIVTHCDPDILLCVLDGTPPVFSEGQ
jgi:hypothetical protein